MVQSQKLNKVSRDLGCVGRVAVGHMGDEVDQFTKRDDARLGGGSWRLHEDAT